MTIQLSTKNFELTQPLRDYVEEKISRLARYDNEVVTAHIRVSRDHHHKHGEVFTLGATLTLLNHSVNAEANAGDPYAATDIVQEKLERELEHWRGRSESRRRRLGKMLNPRQLSRLPQRQWRWLRKQLSRQDHEE